MTHDEALESIAEVCPPDWQATESDWRDLDSVEDKPREYVETASRIFARWLIRKLESNGCKVRVRTDTGELRVTGPAECRQDAGRLIRLKHFAIEVLYHDGNGKRC